MKKRPSDALRLEGLFIEFSDLAIIFLQVLRLG